MPRTLFPGIMSLWEGLYAWLVIMLSTLVSVLGCTLLLPLFDLSYQKFVLYKYYNSVLSYVKPIPTYKDDYESIIIVLLTSFWMIVAALIYQIEFLFKRRLSGGYSVANIEEKPNNEVKANSYIDVELDRLRGEMGLTQVKKGKSNSPKMQAISTQKAVNNRKFEKKLLLILLIPVLAVGIYLFSPKPENPPTNPGSVTSQPQLPSTPATVPSSPPAVTQIDNFREAVNQANNAALATQRAKSQEEWNIVVKGWQKAIEFMKKVPNSSPNYQLSQQKISEYQRNLDYAQKNAALKK